MFCNIFERIADTIFNLVILDRVKSSHYALVFGDIHLLQGELYIHIVCCGSQGLSSEFKIEIVS